MNNISSIVKNKLDMDKVTNFVKSVSDLTVKQKELLETLEKISGTLERMVKCEDDLQSCSDSSSSSSSSRSTSKSPKTDGSPRHSKFSFFSDATENDDEESKQSPKMGPTNH